MTVTRTGPVADADLVAAARAGDDEAFEQLYSRYRPRITSFVRGMLHDDARAEDVTQETFLSALRRLRETHDEIAFKPWIYQIARNAAIDSHRRRSRTEEVSMDADAGLRASDHVRLVDSTVPDSVIVDRERLEYLRGAFDELSDVHTRVLVMRELEGMSFREIGERLDLSRAAVETALQRARHLLESEYTELAEGRRCAAMRSTIARLAEGVGGERDSLRLGRHARRCALCRRRARELGVEPALVPAGIRGKIAALLPLPVPSTAQITAFLSEKGAALAAIAAVAGAGAGGAALTIESQRDDGRGSSQPPAVERELEREKAALESRAPTAREPRRRGADRGERSLKRSTRAERGREAAPRRERLRRPDAERPEAPAPSSPNATGRSGDRVTGGASGSAPGPQGGGGSSSSGTGSGSSGSSQSGLGGVTEGVGNTVGQLGTGVGNTVGQLGTGVGNTVGQLGSGVGQTLNQVSPGLGDGVSQVTNGLGNTVGEVSTGLGNTVGQLSNGLGNTLGQLGKPRK